MSESDKQDVIERGGAISARAAYLEIGLLWSNGESTAKPKAKAD